MALINFSNSEDKGYSPLPEGSYDLEILSVEQKVSQAGNPQLEINTEVAGGEHEGRKVRLWYSLTPQSAWKLKKLVVATHTPHEVVGSDRDGQISFDTDDLIGGIFVATAVPGINPKSGKAKVDFNDERPSKLMAIEPPAMPAQVQAAAPPVVQVASQSPAQQTLTVAPEASFRRRSRA